MFGKVLKYSLVAAAGAVTFVICMYSADESAVERVRELIRDYEETILPEHPDPVSRGAAMMSYIKLHREEWENSVTSATGLKEMQKLFKPYL